MNRKDRLGLQHEVLGCQRGIRNKTESWKVKGSNGKSERMNQSIRFLEARILLHRAYFCLNPGFKKSFYCFLH